jgi:phosphoribosylformylglycinamidine synthase PurS subunit
MKAKVFVTLKSGVLDPQGKAIHHSVEMLGTKGILDIRQGKYFEVSIDPSISESEARKTIEKIAKDVLANPVIEDYKLKLEL